MADPILLALRSDPDFWAKNNLDPQDRDPTPKEMRRCMHRLPENDPRREVIREYLEEHGGLLHDSTRAIGRERGLGSPIGVNPLIAIDQLNASRNLPAQDVNRLVAMAEKDNLRPFNELKDMATQEPGLAALAMLMQDENFKGGVSSEMDAFTLFFQRNPDNSSMIEVAVLSPEEYQAYQDTPEGAARDELLKSIHYNPLFENVRAGSAFFMHEQMGLIHLTVSSDRGLTATALPGFSERFEGHEYLKKIPVTPEELETHFNFMSMDAFYLGDKPYLIFQGKKESDNHLWAQMFITVQDDNLYWGYLEGENLSAVRQAAKSDTVPPYKLNDVKDITNDPEARKRMFTSHPQLKKKDRFRILEVTKGAEKKEVLLRLYALKDNPTQGIHVLEDTIIHIPQKEGAVMSYEFMTSAGWEEEARKEQKSQAVVADASGASKEAIKKDSNKAAPKSAQELTEEAKEAGHIPFNQLASLAGDFPVYQPLINLLLKSKGKFADLRSVHIHGDLEDHSNCFNFFFMKDEAGKMSATVVPGRNKKMMDILTRAKPVSKNQYSASVRSLDFYPLTEIEGQTFLMHPQLGPILLSLDPQTRMVTAHYGSAVDDFMKAPLARANTPTEPQIDVSTDQEKSLRLLSDHATRTGSARFDVTWFADKKKMKKMDGLTMQDAKYDYFLHEFRNGAGEYVGFCVARRSKSTGASEVVVIPETADDYRIFRPGNARQALPTIQKLKYYPLHYREGLSPYDFFIHPTYGPVIYSFDGTGVKLTIASDRQLAPYGSEEYRAEQHMPSITVRQDIEPKMVQPADQVTAAVVPMDLEKTLSSEDSFNVHEPLTVEWFQKYVQNPNNPGVVPLGNAPCIYVQTGKRDVLLFALHPVGNRVVFAHLRSSSLDPEIQRGLRSRVPGIDLEFKNTDAFLDLIQKYNWDEKDLKKLNEIQVVFEKNAHGVPMMNLKSSAMSICASSMYEFSGEDFSGYLLLLGLKVQAKISGAEITWQEVRVDGKNELTKVYRLPTQSTKYAASSIEDRSGAISEIPTDKKQFVAYVKNFSNPGNRLFLGKPFIVSSSDTEGCFIFLTQKTETGEILSAKLLRGSMSSDSTWSRAHRDFIEGIQSGEYEALAEKFDAMTQDPKIDQNHLAFRHKETGEKIYLYFEPANFPIPSTFKILPAVNFPREETVIEEKMDIKISKDQFDKAFSAAFPSLMRDYDGTHAKHVGDEKYIFITDPKWRGYSIILVKNGKIYWNASFVRDSQLDQSKRDAFLGNQWEDLTSEYIKSGGKWPPNPHPRSNPLTYRLLRPGISSTKVMFGGEVFSKMGTEIFIGDNPEDDIRGFSGEIKPEGVWISYSRANSKERIRALIPWPEDLLQGFRASLEQSAREKKSVPAPIRVPIPKPVKINKEPLSELDSSVDVLNGHQAKPMFFRIGSRESKSAWENIEPTQHFPWPIQVLQWNKEGKRFIDIKWGGQDAYPITYLWEKGRLIPQSHKRSGASPDLLEGDLLLQGQKLEVIAGTPLHERLKQYLSRGDLKLNVFVERQVVDAEIGEAPRIEITFNATGDRNDEFLNRLRDIWKDAHVGFLRERGQEEGSWGLRFTFLPRQEQQVIDLLKQTQRSLDEVPEVEKYVYGGDQWDALQKAAEKERTEKKKTDSDKKESSKIKKPKSTEDKLVLSDPDAGAFDVTITRNWDADGTLMASQRIIKPRQGKVLSEVKDGKRTTVRVLTDMHLTVSTVTFTPEGPQITKVKQAPVEMHMPVLELITSSGSVEADAYSVQIKAVRDPETNQYILLEDPVLTLDQKVERDLQNPGEEPFKFKAKPRLPVILKTGEKLQFDTNLGLVEFKIRIASIHLHRTTAGSAWVKMDGDKEFSLVGEIAGGSHTIYIPLEKPEFDDGRYVKPRLMVREDQLGRLASWFKILGKPLDMKGITDPVVEVKQVSDDQWDFIVHSKSDLTKRVHTLSLSGPGFETLNANIKKAGQPEGARSPDAAFFPDTIAIPPPPVTITGLQQLMSTGDPQYMMTGATQTWLDGIFAHMKQNKFSYAHNQSIPERLEFENSQGVVMSIPVKWCGQRTKGPPFALDAEGTLKRDEHGHPIKDAEGRFQTESGKRIEIYLKSNPNMRFPVGDDFKIHDRGDWNFYVMSHLPQGRVKLLDFRLAISEASRAVVSLVQVAPEHKIVLDDETYRIRAANMIKEAKEETDWRLYHHLKGDLSLLPSIPLRGRRIHLGRQKEIAVEFMGEGGVAGDKIFLRGFRANRAIDTLDIERTIQLEKNGIKVDFTAHETGKKDVVELRPSDANQPAYLWFVGWDVLIPLVSKEWKDGEKQDFSNLLDANGYPNASIPDYYSGVSHDHVSRKLRGVTVHTDQEVDFTDAEDWDFYRPNDQPSVVLAQNEWQNAASGEVIEVTEPDHVKSLFESFPLDKKNFLPVVGTLFSQLLIGRDRENMTFVTRNGWFLQIPMQWNGNRYIANTETADSLHHIPGARLMQLHRTKNGVAFLNVSQALVHEKRVGNSTHYDVHIPGVQFDFTLVRADMDYTAPDAQEGDAGKNLFGLLALQGAAPTSLENLLNETRKDMKVLLSLLKMDQKDRSFVTVIDKTGNDTYLIKDLIRGWDEKGSAWRTLLESLEDDGMHLYDIRRDPSGTALFLLKDIKTGKRSYFILNNEGRVMAWDVPDKIRNFYYQGESAPFKMVAREEGNIYGQAKDAKKKARESRMITEWTAEGGKHEIALGRWDGTSGRVTTADAQEIDRLPFQSFFDRSLGLGAKITIGITDPLDERYHFKPGHKGVFLEDVWTDMDGVMHLGRGLLLFYNDDPNAKTEDEKPYAWFDFENREMFMHEAGSQAEMGFYTPVVGSAQKLKPDDTGFLTRRAGVKVTEDDMLEFLTHPNIKTKLDGMYLGAEKLTSDMAWELLGQTTASQRDVPLLLGAMHALGLIDPKTQTYDRRQLAAISAWAAIHVNKIGPEAILKDARKAKLAKIPLASMGGGGSPTLGVRSRRPATALMRGRDGRPLSLLKTRNQFGNVHRLRLR